MPIADVEKIVRKEPLDAFYDVGKELGRYTSASGKVLVYDCV